VSVDTYLKGKNTSQYTVVRQEDVKVLVSPRLVQWAKRVQVGAKRFLLWDSFDVEAEHRHTIACQH
jgi:hypothetical protein